MAKKQSEKTEQQKFQEKYIEYNFLKNRIQGLTEELQTLASTNQSLNIAKETIEGFDGLKDSTEILVPIGAQFFAIGKLSSHKEVLANVGAGAVVKKDTKSALATIAEQQKELAEMTNEVNEQIKETSHRMEALEPEMDVLGEKIQGTKKQRRED